MGSNPFTQGIRLYGSDTYQGKVEQVMAPEDVAAEIVRGMVAPVTYRDVLDYDWYEESE